MDQVTVAMLISDPGLNARVLRALANLPVRAVMKSPDAASEDELFGEREPRRSNFDVVFLEVVTAGERTLNLIRMIKNRASPPAVVTVHPNADTEGLLAAFRAGADDCLYLPVDEAAVRQVFERVVEKRERQRPQRVLAKTVGFLSSTGGCGGTMVACHFANELWRATSQNTLLADFDLMAGMVGFWMRSPNDYSIWDVVRSWQRLDATMWRGLVFTAQPQLDVLSAPSEVISDEVCDSEQFFNVMQFARSHYDWVVADLGASLSTLSLRLLGQLNALFLISSAELPVLYQTKRVLRKLLALGYPRRRVRLVLNCVRKRQLEADEVSEALGWQVEADLPYDAAEIEEAQADGHLLSRKSDLGKRIAQLTARFMNERLEEAEGFQVQVPGAVPAVRALTRAWQQGWRRTS
jgi:pilus assembly protein CpaE